MSGRVAPWAAVVAVHADDPSVERATLFGFECLRTRGKVFAKLDGEQVVLRLPAAEVERLVAAGSAQRYQRRHQTLKGWAVVNATDRGELLELTQSARRAVPAPAPSGRRGK